MVVIQHFQSLCVSEKKRSFDEGADNTGEYSFNVREYLLSQNISWHIAFLLHIKGSVGIIRLFAFFFSRMILKDSVAYFSNNHFQT